MWMFSGLVALDLALQREREAEEQAARWRLAREVTEFGHDGRSPRRNALRAALARPVRGFSDATHAVSDAACTAATRIEGGTA